MKYLLQLLTLLITGLLNTTPSHADIIYGYNQLSSYPVNQITYVPYAFTAPLLPISFTLNIATSQIEVGDYFDVDVVVHNLFANDTNDELLAFGLNAISSNTALLRLTGSTINPLFSDDSASLGLDAAGSAFPGISYDPTVAPAFSVATLHFHALAAGNVSLTVISDLADANQGLFYLNQGPMAIDASRGLTISAVPLPSGLLLFGSGLAISLGAFRKRKA